MQGLILNSKLQDSRIEIVIGSGDYRPPVEENVDLDGKLAQKSAGYKRALDRYPHLAERVASFGNWLEAVEQWLTWIDQNVPDGVHATRAELVRNFHVSHLGLEILERLNIDIYADGRETSRREYDIKKILRAIVCLPTISRLKGKHLDRKHQKITTVFKEIIDDTLNGRTDIASLSCWQPPSSPSESADGQV